MITCPNCDGDMERIETVWRGASSGMLTHDPDTYTCHDCGYCMPYLPF